MPRRRSWVGRKVVLGEICVGRLAERRCRFVISSTVIVGGFCLCWQRGRGGLAGGGGGQNRAADRKAPLYSRIDTGVPLLTREVPLASRR